MKKSLLTIIATVIMVLGCSMVCYAKEDIQPPLVDHEFIYGYDEYYTNDPIPVFGYSFQKEAVEWKVWANGGLYYEQIEGMEQYAFVTRWRYYRDGEDGNSEGWQIVKADYTPADNSMMINKVNIIGSDVDVYDSTGNLVFPPPRPALEVILEQTTQTIPNKVGGEMKTLALCGVGCLALLMVLSLFGKVFSIYRVK